jgi:hypothetical protein
MYIWLCTELISTIQEAYNIHIQCLASIFEPLIPLIVQVGGSKLLARHCACMMHRYDPTNSKVGWASL